MGPESDETQVDAGTGIDNVLGLHSRTVVVGGDAQVALVLRPMSVRQQRDIANEFKDSDDLVGYSLATIHAGAQRAGYGGTRDDLGDLLEGDDRLRCEAAKDEMLPFTIQKLREREERARAAVTPAVVAEVIQAMAQAQPSKPADQPEASGD